MSGVRCVLPPLGRVSLKSPSVASQVLPSPPHTRQRSSLASDPRMLSQPTCLRQTWRLVFIEDWTIDSGLIWTFCFFPRLFYKSLQVRFQNTGFIIFQGILFLGKYMYLLSSFSKWIKQIKYKWMSVLSLREAGKQILSLRSFNSRNLTGAQNAYVCAAENSPQ